MIVNLCCFTEICHFENGLHFFQVFLIFSRRTPPLFFPSLLMLNSFTSIFQKKTKMIHNLLCIFFFSQFVSEWNSLEYFFTNEVTSLRIEYIRNFIGISLSMFPSVLLSFWYLVPQHSVVLVSNSSTFLSTFSFKFFRNNMLMFFSFSISFYWSLAAS